MKDKNELHYECNSCPSQMASVRERVRKSALQFGFDEETVSHLVLAVDEACTNIIRHAYGGKTDQKIEVDIQSHGSTWEVRLRDYGKKCDPSKLKGRDLDDIKPGGLGLFFIKKAFDDVQFDPSVEIGSRLILRKNKKS
jgi:anti-sigma regulatory factor (Ser/Thr protein kinase)